MVVPYGFGVGDFAAVGTLAWSVYKSCRAAPNSFNNISIEVLSLHAVLKEADETIFRSPLSPESQARLKTIGDGCQCVLGDLQALVDKYESLGTQSKRTWDRMKWGAEDIVEVRSRIISNTTLLTAFMRWAAFLFKYPNLPLIQLLLSTSQTSVEQKLDKLISDFQQGKRAPSVISLQTVDSLDPDDKEAWRTIRKELEDIGISVAAFDANKDFIFEWFSNAVDTGAFQEQAVSSPSGSVHSLDVLSSTSSFSTSEAQESYQTVMSDTEPPKASKAKTKSTGNYTNTQAKPASNGIVAGSGPHAPVIPIKLPRIAALIGSLSRPKKRLKDAVAENDVDRIKEILMSAATSRLIDRRALNYVLYSTMQFGYATSKEACALLIDAGADINRPYTDIFRQFDNLLSIAVWRQEIDLVAFFLDRGANVNYQSGKGDAWSSALRLAVSRDDEAMITLLSQRGADINAVQKVHHLRSSLSNRYPTAIHDASAESSVSVVDLLINLGADLTYSPKGFGTPLVLAIYKGRLATVELLIKRGANINEVPAPLGKYNILFRSTVHIAIHKNSPALVKLLLDNGAVADWNDAFVFVAEQVSINYSANRVEGYSRPIAKIREDALAVQRLIEKKMEQESAVQN